MFYILYNLCFVLTIFFSDGNQCCYHIIWGKEEIKRKKREENRWRRRWSEKMKTENSWKNEKKRKESRIRVQKWNISKNSVKKEKNKSTYINKNRMKSQNKFTKLKFTAELFDSKVSFFNSKSNSTKKT